MYVFFSDAAVPMFFPNGAAGKVDIFKTRGCTAILCNGEKIVTIFWTCLLLPKTGKTRKRSKDLIQIVTLSLKRVPYSLNGFKK